MAKRSRLRATALESGDAIELLAEKWRIVILHLLDDHTLRTHELQSAIEGISPKMLTQTLRGMERDGLLTRTVHPVAPPHVEYQLTKMGRSVITRFANSFTGRRRTLPSATPRGPASIPKHEAQVFSDATGTLDSPCILGADLNSGRQLYHEVLDLGGVGAQFHCADRRDNG